MSSVNVYGPLGSSMKCCQVMFPYADEMIMLPDGEERSVTLYAVWKLSDIVEFAVRFTCCSEALLPLYAYTVYTPMGSMEFILVDTRFPFWKMNTFCAGSTISFAFMDRTVVNFCRDSPGTRVT